jgi:glyoxylase-like metal-dependent hydrolase (beta-lactamase superfamily II)
LILHAPRSKIALPPDLPESPVSRSFNLRFVSSVVIASALALVACSKKEETPPPAAAAQPPAAVAPAAETPPPAAAKPSPPAPALTAREEGAHAFRIGQLSAFALRDGSMQVPNDNSVFGMGKTPEDVAAVLTENGQPTDKMALSIQPLLVKTADKVLLFDTGASTNFGPANGKLPASLAEAGIDPQSVTDVFISHVHGDHVGGLVDAKGAATFPNATVHISKPEWMFLTEMKADVAKMSGIPNRDAIVAAIKPKLDAFVPGAELVPGVVKAVEIKGHTPGHSGYMIMSGADSLLYIGDAMHQFIISVQKPEWINAYDENGPVAAASRVALLNQLSTSGQRIYAVHFPFPGIGKITGRGNDFGWVGE